MAIEKAYTNFKSAAKSMTLVKIWSSLCWKLRTNRANGVSKAFWEDRYRSGGTSGPGSYGRLAEFKISTINSIVEQHNIASILDMGCGDGNQIRQLADVDYLGVDISEDAINHCRELYSCEHNRAFRTVGELGDDASEMTLSLDVIYHLVEDPIYNRYMADLFNRADRYVLVYSSNFDQLCLNPMAHAAHVRHRPFTDWVDTQAVGWKLRTRIQNPFKKSEPGSSANVSFADFFLFEKARD